MIGGAAFAALDAMTAKPKKRKSDPGPVSSTPYSRLWRDWLSRNRGLYMLGLLLMAMSALATAAYAKLMQWIVAAFESRDFSVMWWGPAGVMAVAVVSSVCDYLRQTTVQRAVIRAETDLQKAMFTQLVGADLAHLRSRGAGRARGALLLGHRPGEPLGQVGDGGPPPSHHHRRLRHDGDDRLAADARHARRLRPRAPAGGDHRLAAEADRRRTQNQVAAMTANVTEGLSGIRMARTYRLEEPLAESAAGVFETLFGLKVRENRWSARSRR